ncbi:MAG: methyltransferase domain-containing protein [Aliifodinibius sp.]|nr:methyltransferase domain-containing protein [Fodinibius sp.]NIV15052.1 methyltransferase domain-containing protein [Fodinibius sp.]NIY28905.1 methyltransferase domain-containing protein [Fodinibius sp.]
MFSKTAAWYDALYSFKDYQQESNSIIERLKIEHPHAKTILDIGCGTAEHDQYLSKIYRLDGLDINPDFVEIASKKNPTCQYFCADMIDFNLEKTYDVVLCLFSSIGYVKTIDNLISTLRCFKHHMNPEGIILVEPWLTPKTWNPEGNVYLLTGETEAGKICRMNISKTRGKLSILTFHYLIGTNSGIEYVTEHHELGLFTIEEMQDAFRQAGLSVTYDPDGLTGRGLYVARGE